MKTSPFALIVRFPISIALLAVSPDSLLAGDQSQNGQRDQLETQNLALRDGAGQMRWDVVRLPVVESPIAVTR